MWVPSRGRYESKNSSAGIAPREHPNMSYATLCCTSFAVGFSVEYLLNLVVVFMTVESGFLGSGGRESAMVK